MADQVIVNNDLLDNIVCDNFSLALKNPAFYLHLETIIDYLRNGYITIPPVQRGKVWNATRVEVLWDSILRGISIGSLVVKPNKEKKWDLLDGQQRVNAISMGFQELEKETASSILWLDLLSNKCSETEKTERKYCFRVTTLAHPWGYHFSDNETQNITLYSSEKRDAVSLLESIGKKWIVNQNNRKPRPSMLWPFTAFFPIPFSILRSFIFQNPTGDFCSFWEYCKETDPFGYSNWFLYLNKEKFEKHKDEIGGENIWGNLRDVITQIRSTIVIAQNSASIPDEDIGLYFRRMNKAGVVPNDEEIRYSLLKSKLPELKIIDEIATNRMAPARMANIAMSSYLIAVKKKKWNPINIQNISELAEEQDGCFVSFVKNDFEKYVGIVEEWMIYDPIKNKMGLPKYLYSMIARKGNGDLYKLLIIFAVKMECINNLEEFKKELIALVSLVSWFGNEAMVSYGYEKYYKDIQYSQNEWEIATRKWVFEASSNNHMAITPQSSAFVPSKFENKQDILLYRNNQAYAETINRFWDWKSYPGRALLLYACRDYLNQEFGQYDPSDAAWSEENCPWDYDHIVPQVWVKYGRASGKYHAEVSSYLNSIGNIAPISFERNREKKDSAPCKCDYLNLFNSGIAIDEPAVYNEFQKPFEDDDTRSLSFCTITATRLYKIYSAWYDMDKLNIDNLFSYESHRKELIDLIEENLNNCFKVESIIKVFTFSNLQFICSCNADWAHPWIAIGIDLGEDKGVFPAVAIGRSNNTFHIEAGLRRHPKHTTIDGKNIWYKGDLLKSVDRDIDKLSISDMSELSKELSDVIKRLYDDMIQSCHD